MRRIIADRGGDEKRTGLEPQRGAGLAETTAVFSVRSRVRGYGWRHYGGGEERQPMLNPVYAVHLLPNPDRTARLLIVQRALRGGVAVFIVGALEAVDSVHQLGFGTRVLAVSPVVACVANVIVGKLGARAHDWKFSVAVLDAYFAGDGQHHLRDALLILGNQPTVATLGLAAHALHQE